MLGLASTLQAQGFPLLHTFDDPTVTSSDLFGSSAAVDGNYVLIGADGDDTSGISVGQAHLFDAITGNLLQTFNDPTVTSQDFFWFFGVGRWQSRPHRGMGRRHQRR